MSCQRFTFSPADSDPGETVCSLPKAARLSMTLTLTTP